MGANLTLRIAEVEHAGVGDIANGQTSKDEDFLGCK